MFFICQIEKRKRLKRIIISLLITLLVLSAGCAQSQEEKVVAEPFDLEMLNIGLIDKGKHYSDLDWSQIHVSKGEFLGYLEELKKLYESEDLEDGPFKIEGFEVEKNKIKVFISNTDEEMASLINMVFAKMFDEVTRELYIHSDYWNGESQPLIIIEDLERGLVEEYDGQ